MNETDPAPAATPAGIITMTGEAVSTPASQPAPDDEDTKPSTLSRAAPVAALVVLAIVLLMFGREMFLALGVGMALVGNTLDRNNDRDRFVAAFPATALLQFWSGSAPAATAAATGTKIAEITLPTSPWDTGTTGSAIKQNTWSTTTTLAGTPGYFRFVNAAATVVRQGVVGVDMTAAAVATNGDTYTVTTLTLTFA